MTPSTRMPPGSYEPHMMGRSSLRESGLALTLLGGLGCLTGLAAGGLWELSPEGDTRDNLMIVSLSAGIPGVVLAGTGLILMKIEDGAPVTASLGPGSLRVTF
jgi:hypothetical protein